jgi:murein DD-endopeptidase MepM/ murein hydrolase activator NlpD
MESATPLDVACADGRAAPARLAPQALRAASPARLAPQALRAASPARLAPQALRAASPARLAPPTRRASVASHVLPTHRAFLPLPALLPFSLLALLLFVTLAPAATGATGAPPHQWSWPLDGPPSVIRGFEPSSAPWLPGHRGVDLRAAPGAPVRAAGPGRVTFAGWVGGVPVVVVTHPDGLRTTYQPVLASVTRGEAVTIGAMLGRLSAGGSHCLPLACLHWGLRRAGTYLDPLLLVGADSEVRLMPVWSDVAPTPRWDSVAGSDQPPPPRSATRPALGAAAPGRSVLARLGALNRARTVPLQRW